MEKKKKNLGKPRIGSIPFLLIWIMAHIGVWVTLFYLSEMGLQFQSETAALVIFGLVMGGGLAIMQKGLIQFTYHAPLKWWLRVTLVSWVIAWFVFYFSFEFFDNLPWGIDDSLGLMLLPLFVIPAAAQWFILRQNVRHAWLWIVAGIVSALAFGALYGNLRDEEVYQFVFGASAQGAVTGLSLLWLYGQARAEKIKTGVG